MTMNLALALRNLLRNRRRSMATLLALAIGTAALLLFGGYSADIRYAMLTGYVRHGGHLQVQHRDFYLYGNGNPTAYAIRDTDAVMAAIAGDELLRRWVVVASPMLQFGGIAGNYDAGVSRTVLGIGYVAADVNRMRQWNEFKVAQTAPHFALEGAKDDSAILGIGVARVLLLCEKLGLQNCPRPQDDKPKTGAELPADIAALAAGTAPAATPATDKRGARIELLAGHGRGTPNVAGLSVLGAEDQGLKELDEVMVVLGLRQAQQLVFGRQPPRSTAVMIQLARTDQIPEAAQRLREVLAQAVPNQPLTVLDFETLNPFYRQTIDLFDTIFGFIFVLIGGIVLFTVSNTMNAAVVERTTEIGTLRSVGLRQSGIRQLFVTEGILLGCAGALVGVLAALTLSGLVNWLGLTWLPPGSSVRLPLNIRVWGETRMMVGAALGLMIIAAVSAWWPARQAAGLKIVDALRHA